MRRSTSRLHPAILLVAAAFVAGTLLAGCGGSKEEAGSSGGGSGGTGEGGPVIQEGSNVAFNYTLKVDGEVVDSSEGKEPFKYTQGSHLLVPGLEEQMAGLSAGDKKEITVPPEKGYGPRNPQAMQTVPKSVFSQPESLKVGGIVSGSSGGQPIQAKVTAISADSITLDMNHPLAGKTLNFTIEVVSVEPGPSPSQPTP